MQKYVAKLRILFVCEIPKLLATYRFVTNVSPIFTCSFWKAGANLHFVKIISNSWHVTIHQNRSCMQSVGHLFTFSVFS